MNLLQSVVVLFTKNGVELVRKGTRSFYETKLNGFKVEVTPRKRGAAVMIRYGYGETSDRLDDLINLMDADNWSRRGSGDSWAMIDSINYTTAADVLSAYDELADALGTEHGLGRRDIRPDVAKLTTKPSINQLAIIMYNLVQADVPFGNLLSRYGFDDRDDSITVGESYLHEATGDTYREHAVPCMMLTQLSLEMLLDGATVADVEDFLNRNLKIVLITKAEAKLIDSIHKTDMPEGWTDGDDPFARFAEAHILITLH